MNKKIKISSSILSANFMELGKEINELQNAGTDYIHIDVMDGVFVPNISIGLPIIKSIKKITNISLDVHLMISSTESMLDDFINAGSDIITIHYESTIHINKAINKIKENKRKAGIAIIPSTPIHFLEEIIKEIDVLLIMSVNPGFGGQTFIESQIKKIQKARELAKELNPLLEISVDGGINKNNANKVIDAGANILVSGTEIFSPKNNYKNNIDKLRGL